MVVSLLLYKLNTEATIRGSFQSSTNIKISDHNSLRLNYFFKYLWLLDTINTNSYHGKLFYMSYIVVFIQYKLGYKKYFNEN